MANLKSVLHCTQILHICILTFHQYTQFSNVKELSLLSELFSIPSVHTNQQCQKVESAIRIILTMPILFLYSHYLLQLEVLVSFWYLSLFTFDGWRICYRFLPKISWMSSTISVYATKLPLEFRHLLRFFHVTSSQFIQICLHVL